MCRPVLLLDVATTGITKSSLSATLLNMVNPNFDSKGLIAPLARLGTHIACFFMVTKLAHSSLVSAVLTLYQLMRSFFVLLSFRFWHNISAFLTLVVVASASNLVHAKLTHFNWFLAV